MAISSIQIPLDDNMLKQIGHVSASFSTADLILCHAIWGILRVNKETGLVITTPMSTTARIQTLKELLNRNYNDRDETVHCIETLDWIFNLSGERNDVTHASWSPSDDFNEWLTAVTMKGRHTGVLHFQMTDIGVLEDLSRDILEATKDLLNDLLSLGILKLE